MDGNWFIPDTRADMPIFIWSIFLVALVKELLNFQEQIPELPSRQTVGNWLAP